MRLGKPPEPISIDLDLLESLRVPDFVEPLYAWRLWEAELVRGRPRLRSLYRLSFWPVLAPFEARCQTHKLRLRRRPRHTVPDADCSCGVYAVRREFIPQLTFDDRVPPWRCPVLGEVALWGDILECERGWRAAYAYPSRLLVPYVGPGSEETALGLGDYGVPVELVDPLELAAGPGGAEYPERDS